MSPQTQFQCVGITPTDNSDRSLKRFFVSGTVIVMSSFMSDIALEIWHFKSSGGTAERLHVRKKASIFHSFCTKARM